jgi:hypothetical protein
MIEPSITGAMHSWCKQGSLAMPWCSAETQGACGRSEGAPLLVTPSDARQSLMPLSAGRLLELIHGGGGSLR